MGHSKERCPNRPIAQSNFTQSYFTLLKPIVPQCIPSNSDGDDNNSGDYDEENNKWYNAPTQKEKLKESDEWLSSLQYLNANINDLTIFKSFLDLSSEFGGLNDLAIKVLGWKADKPSNFTIKDNSKHITDLLG
ncbi:hypothetical protein C1645_825335 [Glomus cerebriforme]|uniref:Uncharacterized protein n=1 Tax=Glomus cerebriforme TaxID=658196 RepID=A0A397T215_9GLOM|nr:hypothetical protein C1645_825335 [Glomus cerebriforme]